MKKQLMKSILSILVLFALVVAPIRPTKTSAYCAHTADEAVAYLNSLVGSKVGTGQCVALIKAYYEYLGVSAVRGNGCDYATNALPDGWTRIAGATPQKGDILVWTEGSNNYGHVAICGGDGVYFHQNWSGQYVQILNKSYTGGYNITSTGERANYWGIIRPDFPGSSITPEPEPYAEFGEGMYYIKNNHDGLYLSVNGCKDAQTQNVGTWALNFPTTNTPVEFQMNFTKTNDNGAYKLRPELCASRIINAYGYTVSSGCNVNIYDDLGETSEWWYFEKVNGGYIIRNVMNPSCVMTVESNQNVIVQTYNGSQSQIWSVQNTVTYDANGGTGAPAVQFKNYDEALTLSTTQPTRYGYVFLGWSTSSTAGYASYATGDSFTSNDNTTLYAVWAPAAYTVTFMDSNGTVLKTETVPYGGSATPPANPTSEGYTFSYWDTPYTNVTTDIVTTAVYATSSYTVTFMDWDNTVISTQTVAYGSAAIAPVPPYHSGCTFIEWDVDYSNITSDLTVTARYYSRIYEVRSQEDFDGRVCILYRVDDENISWRAAKEFCEANGGHLLTVSDENEQADIDSLNIEGVPLWLGASDEDQDGIWEWVTGEPFEYTYWLQGEPNYMDGVEMYLGTFPFEWNDFNEANANIKGFIMEIDSINTEEESCRLIGEVNGDGIVNSLDAAQVLKHDAQLITLAGEGLAAADINGDGVVNSLDAAQILKFDAQLITEF